MDRTAISSLVRLAVAALFGLAAPGGPGAANGPAAPDCLPRLIAERLELMPAVAHYKWLNRRPIEDAAREAAILDGLAARDDLQGLAPGFVRRFFRAQIEAAKDIQRRRFDAWAGGASLPATEPASLKTEIRPKLDHLTTQLITCLAETVAREPDGGALIRLSVPPPTLSGDRSAWAIAVAPLLALGPSP